MRYCKETHHKSGCYITDGLNQGADKKERTNEPWESLVSYSRLEPGPPLSGRRLQGHTGLSEKSCDVESTAKDEKNRWILKF